MWGDVLPRSLLERPGSPIGCWLLLPPDWLVLGADWQLGQCGRTVRELHCTAQDMIALAAASLQPLAALAAAD